MYLHILTVFYLTQPSSKQIIIYLKKHDSELPWNILYTLVGTLWNKTLSNSKFFSWNLKLNESHGLRRPLGQDTVEQIFRHVSHAHAGAREMNGVSHTRYVKSKIVYTNREIHLQNDLAFGYSNHKHCWSKWYRFRNPS